MASILDFYPDRFERLMTWARYLYWSDIHFRHFNAFMNTDHDVKDDRQGWEFVALMSAWYSSLWVVVEGWTEVPLSDPFVDQLLDASPRYKDLLRRYRNGVYHYQPTFNERRLLDFLHEGEGTIYWTFFLHVEFCRFYWELVESLPADLADLREEIIKIVGWIPSDIPAARFQSARERAQQATSMLREAGDFSTPAARDVVRAAQGSIDEAAKLEVEFQNWKAEVLERIKREGGSG
jgi:hypothetical protein